MKRIILAIAIMFVMFAGGDFRASAQQYEPTYTTEELQELLQLMCDMFNETEESGNPDVAIEYMRYEESANKLVIRYKINSESLFSDILHTPHTDLKERFLPLLAKKYMGDADVKEMMTLVFRYLDPHVVYQFSNGKGTTVNCEFEGTEVAQTMGGTSTHALLAAKSEDEADAANELAALVEETRAGLTQNPDDVFNLFDIDFYPDDNTVIIYGEFDLDYSDFLTAVEVLEDQRTTLLESFRDNPLMNHIIANNGNLWIVMRSKQSPERDPKTIRFYSAEIKRVLN